MLIAELAPLSRPGRRRHALLERLLAAAGVCAGSNECGVMAGHCWRCLAAGRCVLRVC